MHDTTIDIMSDITIDTMNDNGYDTMRSITNNDVVSTDTGGPLGPSTSAKADL